MDTTRLSTKGQIILPKGIRDSRAWGPAPNSQSKKPATVSCSVPLPVSPVPISKRWRLSAVRSANRERPSGCAMPLAGK